MLAIDPRYDAATVYWTRVLEALAQAALTVRHDLAPTFVIPAKAGIQWRYRQVVASVRGCVRENREPKPLDPGLRRDDE